MALPEPCLVIDGSARVGVRVGVISASQWSGQAIAVDGALESTFACARAALAEAGLQLSDIKSFAVCVGPGSVLGSPDLGDVGPPPDLCLGIADRFGRSSGPFGPSASVRGRFGI